jgi:hypothetical protein
MRGLQTHRQQPEQNEASNINTVTISEHRHHSAPLHLREHINRPSSKIIASRTLLNSFHSAEKSMMHVMNPGVQNPGCFPGTRSTPVPFLNNWDEKNTAEDFTHPQKPNHYVQQQYEVPIVDEPHHKRLRGKPEVLSAPSRAHDVPFLDMDHQHCGKRSRGNEYRAPREVKKTVTSVLGSLVGGGMFHQTTNTVIFRRQLSSSQLDQFMSHGDDKMDEDPTPVRERAMSF